MESAYRLSKCDIDRYPKIQSNSSEKIEGLVVTATGDPKLEARTIFVISINLWEISDDSSMLDFLLYQ